MTIMENVIIIMIVVKMKAINLERKILKILTIMKMILMIERIIKSNIGSDNYIMILNAIKIMIFRSRRMAWNK